MKLPRHTQDTLKARALAALAQLGPAHFEVVAHTLGECPRRVRHSLDHLRRTGHIVVQGHVPCPHPGPGRPRALFAPRPAFVLGQFW